MFHALGRLCFSVDSGRISAAALLTIAPDRPCCNILSDTFSFSLMELFEPHENKQNSLQILDPGSRTLAVCWAHFRNFGAAKDRTESFAAN